MLTNSTLNQARLILKAYQKKKSSMFTGVVQVWTFFRNKSNKLITAFARVESITECGLALILF